MWVYYVKLGLYRSLPKDNHDLEVTSTAPLLLHQARTHELNTLPLR
jgi:hypothetical protein